MARINFTHPYLNVAIPAVDRGTGAATSVPEYKPGFETKCDSGIYRYLQANSAVLEGNACKVVLSGVATSNYNATPIDTTLSGTLPTDIGICVAAGGLAAKQWGWFWLGEGEEYCSLATGVASYTNNLCTWTTAGLLAGIGSGDNIADLTAIDSSTSSGTSLRLCRSPRLLRTNLIIAATVSTG